MAQSTSSDIAAAVKALAGGGVVAFPTETVYGLGGDARSAHAVAKIFSVKGRPSTNPVIVHVSDESIARRYAARWPEQATRLAAAFWPGPLTLVVAKTGEIVSEVTAGLPAVGLRVPSHPLALQLLRAFDGPVAAPSANRSGRISPTTAEHVRKELGAGVDVILDGGACQVGIESTVLDLTGLDRVGGRPRILRPGGVSREQIEAVIGRIDETSPFALHPGDAAISPGLHKVHYSPRTPMFRFEADQASVLLDWRKRHPHESAVLLAGENSAELARQAKADLIVMPYDKERYANKIYAQLHSADAGGYAAIWVEMPPVEAGWVAVRDRLIRASKSL